MYEDVAQLQKVASRFYSACMTMDAEEIRALSFKDEIGIEELCKEVLGILNGEHGYAPRWKVLAVIYRVGDL